MSKIYKVVGVPHTGFDGYKRGGLILGKEPVSFRVKAKGDESPLAEGEVSQEQLEQLRSDPRVHFVAGNGHMADDDDARPAPKPAAKAEHTK